MSKTAEELIKELIDSREEQVKILRKSLLSRDDLIQMLQETIKKQDLQIELLRTENRILTSKTKRL